MIHSWMPAMNKLLLIGDLEMNLYSASLAAVPISKL